MPFHKYDVPFHSPVSAEHHPACTANYPPVPAQPQPAKSNCCFVISISSSFENLPKTIVQPIIIDLMQQLCDAIAASSQFLLAIKALPNLHHDQRSKNRDSVQ
jgi:hypothetical protein